MVWSVLGTTVDLMHALSMAAWALGLPLLVWHRWPRLTRAYAIYAIAFVVISQSSRLVLGECFLTTIARALWQQPGGATAHEWFTVRLAQAVFSLSPSHRSIAIASEVLAVLTAAGVLFAMRKLSRAAAARDGKPRVA
jgi:hypothetical protein